MLIVNIHEHSCDYPRQWKKSTTVVANFCTWEYLEVHPQKRKGNSKKDLYVISPPNRGERDEEKLCPDWENEEGQTRQIKDKPYKEFSLYCVIDSQIGLYIKESQSKYNGSQANYWEMTKCDREVTR